MSSHIATPAHAREHWICPIARTFGDKPQERCRGEQCAVWRWKPIMADEIKEAVAKAMQDGMQHKAAVAYVMANRRDLGLPDTPYQGWCGLGSKPEA
jgi:hypothetical protein